MELRLPPQKDKASSESLHLDSGERLIVLGANGAGKTRFTRSIIEALGDKSLHLNVLTALYDRSTEVGTAKPWTLRAHLGEGATARRTEPAATDLELLLQQLMHEEMLNLIGYKLALADGKDATLPRTRLDRVIEIWQDIFPSNRVLIDSGRLLFARGLDPEAYSSLRLSDGERAVLYYTGAVLYAPRRSVVFVESPELFLHPTLTTSLWNRLEALRSDCAFCYTTHDLDFAASRNAPQHIWVRDFDSASATWDYSILPSRQGITNDIYLALTGSRKPVLFIEGEPRSIDARLYPLIFPDYTVRSLGSCNKVIEATRTFNDISAFHNMDSMGIVDRDRRIDQEVAYLRRKRIMVPEVAEVENIFILEDVMRAMALSRGKNAARVVAKVTKAVTHLFEAELKAQALMHTRHRIKRTMEYKVDGRFDSIGALERHLAALAQEMAPRRIYEGFCNEFHDLVARGDYAGILRVFNLKSMLSSCNVAPLCGFGSKDEYIDGVIALLRSRSPYAETIRNAVRRCLTGDIDTDATKDKDIRQ